MSISFRDVAYKVQIPIPGKRNQTKERIVLKNHSGIIEKGELTILMGSSGAGKSSLLNILSQRTHNGASGSILFNGKPADAASMREELGFVTQDDVVLETLTPREMLMYQAQLQLPADMPLEKKTARVEEILHTLRIHHVADTVVGSPMLVHGLSGGERKRLNIALSLLKSPRIIFCDEPTSGLDSTTSFRLMKTLKRLAKQGRTVVATLHQPSPDIFVLFDKLYLMSEGEMVYYGPAREAVPYIASLGYQCPSGFNPADFLIELMQSTLKFPVTQTDRSKFASFIDTQSLADDVSASSSSDDDDGDDEDAANIQIPHDLVPFEADDVSVQLPLIDSTAARLERVHYLIRCFRRSSYRLQIIKAQNLMQPSSPSAVSILQSQVAQSSWQQSIHSFIVLTRRAARCASRDKMLTKVRMGQTVGMSVILSLLYMGMSTEQSGISDRRGVIFFFALMCFMNSLMAVLSAFCLEQKVFIREYLDGLYSPTSYFISKVLTEAPLVTFFPFLFAIIAYFWVGFQLSAAKFFIFAAVLMLMALTGSSIGFWLAAIFGEINSALSVAPGVMVPFLLFSGFFVKLSNITVVLRWFQYLSPIKYGVESLLVNEFSGLTFHCSAEEYVQFGGQSVCPFTSGDAVLSTLSLSDTPIGRSVGLLVALASAFLLLAWRTLDRSAKKSLSA